MSAYNAGSCLVSDAGLDEFRPKHRDILHLNNPAFDGVNHGYKKPDKLRMDDDIEDVSSELELLMSGRSSKHGGIAGCPEFMKNNCSRDKEMNRRLEEFEADCLQESNNDTAGGLNPVERNDKDKCVCRIGNEKPLNVDEYNEKDKPLAAPVQKHGLRQLVNPSQKQTSSQLNILHWPESKRSNIELGPDHEDTDESKKTGLDDVVGLGKLASRVSVKEPSQAGTEVYEEVTEHGVDRIAVRRDGRKSMEHKTIVHGEITRYVSSEHLTL